MRPFSRTLASRMREVSPLASGRASGFSWKLMFLPALLVLQATFQSPRLVESSGVAVSHAYRGVLWTHNDSGDGPYLYATDLRGSDRGALLVPGADAIDAIRLYRVDRSHWSTRDTSTAVTVATLVQTLDIRPNPEAGRLVTAGAVRSDRRPVAPRTYTRIYLFYP